MRTTTGITVGPGTEETTTSAPSLSPSAGRRDPAAAGDYVGELFTEHGRMVVGLCRLLLRDPIEAEDAAQQVFLSVHHAVLRGSTPRDSALWIAAIARNECRARIRARMRAPLELPELASDLPDPLAAAIRAADLEAVWTALSALPRRQRRALVLRELGGLSYHELGRALGVSHSAVESLIFRARQQVRSLVARVNAAVLPIALRDELARLIPGFDPVPAGLVARLAAMPVAVKLASAAVGVGVVATGADGLQSHRARPNEVQPAMASAGPVQRPGDKRAMPTSARDLAQQRIAQRHAAGLEPAQARHEGRGRDEAEHPQTDLEGQEPAEVEERDMAESSGPGPGDAEAAESAGDERSDHIDDNEDHSGPGVSGSDGSGSGSSGSGSGFDSSGDD